VFEILSGLHTRRDRRIIVFLSSLSVGTVEGRLGFGKSDDGVVVKVLLFLVVDLIIDNSQVGRIIFFTDVIKQTFRTKG